MSDQHHHTHLLPQVLPGRKPLSATTPARGGGDAPSAPGASLSKRAEPATVAHHPPHHAGLVSTWQRMLTAELEPAAKRPRVSGGGGPGGAPHGSHAAPPPPAPPRGGPADGGGASRRDGGSGGGSGGKAAGTRAPLELVSVQSRRASLPSPSQNTYPDLHSFSSRVSRGGAGGRRPARPRPAPSSPPSRSFLRASATPLSTPPPPPPPPPRPRSGAAAPRRRPMPPLLALFPPSPPFPGASASRCPLPWPSQRPGRQADSFARWMRRRRNPSRERCGRRARRRGLRRRARHRSAAAAAAAVVPRRCPLPRPRMSPAASCRAPPRARRAAAGRGRGAAARRARNS